jgi:hypothetical protein
MSFGAVNEATKNKENKSDCGLRRQPDDNLYNNQPKICRNNRGGIIQDARPDGEVRGAQSHQFWGDQVGRRLKNEMK